MSLYKRYKKDDSKIKPESLLLFLSIWTHKMILSEIKRESLDPSTKEFSLPKMFKKCFPTQEFYSKALNP